MLNIPKMWLLLLALVLILLVNLAIFCAVVAGVIMYYVGYYYYPQYQYLVTAGEICLRVMNRL